MRARRRRARGGAIALLAALAALSGPSRGAAADFVLTVEKQAKPAPIVFRARKDEAVTMALASDRPVAVHLHGYGLSAAVAPERPAAWRFTARATGRFPIHVHAEGEAERGRHGEPYAFLEIHPR